MKIFSKDMIITIIIGIILCIIVLISFGKKETVVTSTEEYYPNLYVSKNYNPSPMEPETVYLTFDDGPSKNTDELMKILARYDVKATFFVLGKNNEYISKVKDLNECGHTVAPHTYSHNYEQIYAWTDSYIKDFNQIFELIQENGGGKSSIFRFPGGSKNSTVAPWARVAIIDEMNRRGFTYYDWNIVSGDDTPVVLAPEVLYQNVIKQEKGKESLVILFHDSDLYTTTPKAVELVIKHYLEKGWKFAPLTKDVAPIQFS
ncbi:MAG: polysaccharide deacetylase family protein [Oscillospiraceae bacterium]